MDIKSKTTFVEKIKNFFMLNWWLVWLSNAAIVVFVFLSMTIMKTQNEEIKDLLKKEVAGVVFLGQNGQVMLGEKTRIDASSNTSFQSAIKNNLINYLVIDAQKITNNYRIKISNADELFDSYTPFNEFGKNFMALNSEKYPKAFGFFKTLLTGAVQAINEDTLPDQIVPYDSSVINYEWNDKEQTFEITVNAMVNTFVYNAVLNNYDRKEGTIQIRAKGYFDLTHNSPINPLGIKYFEIGVTNASKK
ncbi:hypothetical protein [Campylobacter showae]|jgi:hypothetical protein|uniref:hypothetical protein n=1 Tax=Campylobacter showae TaxID=204 RepID=UPI000F07A428|nr:hypothetical protein [Campylobacter showae]